jgi:Cd2+/Zn2+-exporting ATPase/Cu+-exporting ATPase
MNRTQVEIPVQGMDCTECTQHVQQALETLPGVEDVRVLLSAEKAILQIDPLQVDVAALRKAVEGAGYSVPLQTLELSIQGMDCTECTQHVQQALCTLSGVASAQVYLASEKAVVHYAPAHVDFFALRTAVEAAGYHVAESTQQENPGHSAPLLSTFTRPVLTLFGLVFGAVLLVVIVGEWLGFFERITDLIPWYVGWGLVLLAGFPIFWNVIKAAFRRRVISHTLMSLGVLAALVVGQWPTGVVIVFFMRVGDYAEHFTTERSRQAVKRLTALAPQTARVERAGTEVIVPIAEVQVDETVVVRPGEVIPVDGVVVSGQATVNQAAITGESMPVEVSAGSQVFAATTATLGSLRVRVGHVGADTTFGRVITMVEEAEAHRAPVQRIADRFSAYFLPVVATIAALTFLITRHPLSAAAVLVVACSCSFALATPIAMLASIGAAASRGVLVKGGKYLELLARAEVLLIDKTGTITAGQPRITDVVALTGYTEHEILTIAASAERYSEHPLAEAVRQAAAMRQISLQELEHFEAIPGQGIRAEVNGVAIRIGNSRMIPDAGSLAVSQNLETEGKTLLYVQRADEVIGVLAASDTLRPEVPAALAQCRQLGVKQIELLTGDNERTAHAQASRLGIAYRAGLLPEDKIQIVKDYQAQGRVVVMVGDGVNDAPALAQADVGIAMGVMGTDIALEAAHAALMREDWNLVPDLFTIAKRTMRVVKMNLCFTILYNLLGLSLAAVGILPPILAAAAQSLPDLGILANSSRLLRQKLPRGTSPFSISDGRGA